jgi:hypothetical protein
VYAVSSTTTSNRDRQEFWRWQQDKIWNFKTCILFLDLNLVMIIVIPWKEALQWWLCVEYELQNDKRVEFINLIRLPHKKGPNVGALIMTFRYFKFSNVVSWARI